MSATNCYEPTYCTWSVLTNRQLFEAVSNDFETSLAKLMSSNSNICPAPCSKAYQDKLSTHIHFQTDRLGHPQIKMAPSLREWAKGHFNKQRWDSRGPKDGTPVIHHFCPSRDLTSVQEQSLSCTLFTKVLFEIRRDILMRAFGNKILHANLRFGHGQTDTQHMYWQWDGVVCPREPIWLPKPGIEASVSSPRPGVDPCERDHVNTKAREESMGIIGFFYLVGKRTSSEASLTHKS